MAQFSPCCHLLPARPSWAQSVFGGTTIRSRIENSKQILRGCEGFNFLNYLKLEYQNSWRVEAFFGSLVALAFGADFKTRWLSEMTGREGGGGVGDDWVPFNCDLI